MRPRPRLSLPRASSFLLALLLAWPVALPAPARAAPPESTAPPQSTEPRQSTAPPQTSEPQATPAPRTPPSVPASPQTSRPPATAARPSAADRALTARLDTLFAAAFAPDKPGAVVRVQRGDATLLRKAYGLADVELGVAMEPDMVLRIGSLTKQFTAAAVYRLAAAGELRLEAPLRTYLPDYPEPGASATLHQLLTHTAGIPSYTSRADFWRRSRLERTPAEMIATWKDEPLDFPPGSDWSYSNSGYFLLGAVIEAVTGESYADHLRDSLLRPLGLRHTWYGDPETIVPGRVPGYQQGEGGLRNAAFLAMSLPFSAGGLLSTVDDLVTWQEKLFHGDEVLSATWRRRLLTPARLTGGRRTAYAAGVGIRRYAGETVVMHGGGINGFSSYLAHVPSHRITVAVLSNHGNPRPGVAVLGRRALAIALGRPLDEQPRAHLSAEELGEYVGVYEIEGGWRGEDGDGPPALVVRLEDDHLTLQEPGDAREPVHFSARDQFYFPDGFHAGRFERAAGGRVAGVTWSAGSQGDRRGVKTDRAPPRREPVELDDPDVLDALVGRYELLPGMVLTVSRRGERLYARATGQSEDRIYPASEGRWFWQDVDAELVFRGWQDGEADAATLHQGGREYEGRRLDEE